MTATTFSTSYREARDRFRTIAQSAGCSLESYAIDQRGPEGETLTLDVAFYGATHPQRVVVVSSGLHGTEGFCGSAIQLALLEQHWPQLNLAADTAVILLHALNPYGFAWRRRCNEENVDLNRNFLLPGEPYQGSAEPYRDLDAFLNPPSPPSPFDPYWLKALGLILRYGLSALKNTLPVGQYDFPKGLFFGGHHSSQTQQILAEHLPHWLGTADQVVHLDLHTGLGKRGAYTLLLDPGVSASHQPRFQDGFGANVVQIADDQSVAYRCRGGLGLWCSRQVPSCSYGFAAVEFGTYPILHMLKALRAENQAHWWDQPGSPTYEWAKQLLVEASAPASEAWRTTVVAKGLALFQQAMKIIE